LPSEHSTYLAISPNSYQRNWLNMFQTRTATTFCYIALISIFLIGCGRSPDTVVTGQVRWNGEPLAYGFITFCPVDGATKTAGAAIENGNYRANDVPPGEKIVQIMASDPPRVAQSSSDVAAVRPTVVIPPDAKGNSQKHRIGSGTQSLDVILLPAE
jgi:hypothetical protein